MENGCIFCSIASKTTLASIVFEDDISLAFLDTRPLFPGHLLLIPRQHIANLYELPDELTWIFFNNARLLAMAVETSLEAQGTFVAINNKVSQSIPHLHVHIVPRNKKDGLRGFFWPRKKYENDEQMEYYRKKISEEVRLDFSSKTRSK
jgi:histidine triad (HIT) family protein